MTSKHEYQDETITQVTTHYDHVHIEMNEPYTDIILGIHDLKLLINKIENKKSLTMEK